ncbi:hypothetical protein C9374_004698 [Naegleria lovaniensis]|uniref:Uncharacterized protein n=1 Tax=Naegleria lovaniensis TaxID=51637 RepID=A0AA88KP62_NAELO|nr:uncharacterized protein C9374_004698 [Naegleria lovaniensis]KAG2383361.1 hypothetical protein C9374_004698 [Naegleria lovaniensis]
MSSSFRVQHLFSVSRLDTEENPILEKRLQNAPAHSTQFVPPQQQFGIALLGVHGSGRSTLMFQYAYSLIRNDPTSSVMILLHRNASPPLPIFDEDDPQVTSCLKRIEVKYIDTYNLLVAFLANIQLLPDESLPRYIFVDNLSTFFAAHQKENPYLSIVNVDDDDGEDFNFAMIPENNAHNTNQLLGFGGQKSSSAANTSYSVAEALHIRVFALLQNTCYFLAQKFPQSSPNFMVTDIDETYPFYARWCPLVLTLSHYRENQAGTSTQQPQQQQNKSNQFILKVALINEMHDPYKLKAVYELTETECILKKLDYALPKFA